MYLPYVTFPPRYSFFVNPLYKFTKQLYAMLIMILMVLIRYSIYVKVILKTQLPNKKPGTYNSIIVSLKTSYETFVKIVDGIYFACVWTTLCKLITSSKH